MSLVMKRFLCAFLGISLLFFSSGCSSIMGGDTKAGTEAVSEAGTTLKNEGKEAESFFDPAAVRAAYEAYDREFPDALNLVRNPGF